MRLLAAALLLATVACDRADAGPPLLPPDTTMVVASDPELRALAAELLPQLAERSGLELREPVRLERRSRDDLERYLRFKLDEELPEERAAELTRGYHLLGLVPGDLQLRELLMAVYLEQVAGFYDPDSTALFVLDDQPAEFLRPLLLHELVHAVQDQTVSLDSLTSAALDNDRRKAAQSAIEGHATLVMMEHLFAETQGEALDVSRTPGFADQLRPALAGARDQYPVLASAPAVVSESLLFPYLEGAGFVLEMWSGGEERGAAFRGRMPTSTEQVLEPFRRLGEEVDRPTDVRLTPAEGEVLFEEVLGRAETDLLLREHGGATAPMATGWDGDRFALVDRDGATSLVWASVWDSAADRDAFVAAFEIHLDRLPAPARLERREVAGRPVAVLRVGYEGEVHIELDGGGA